MFVNLLGCFGFVEFGDSFLCPESADAIFLAVTSKSFWQFAIHGIELGQEYCTTLNYDNARISLVKNTDNMGFSDCDLTLH
uniref:Secreted protein n=1 Tax=Steinernema glaseri TaxID=37863 RepID=A0A1I7YEH6_9BILA